MSTERDQLADLIERAGINSPCTVECLRLKDAEHYAEAILAAGYRKPRIINDWAELAKLHMVVVRTEAGTIANIMDGRAYCFGYEQSAPVGALALPVTILWEPTNV